MNGMVKVEKQLPVESMPAQQFLTFVLAGELFAVETLLVKEIIGFGQITTVPMMSASIRGVINLRGAVVPVIDLKARFGWERTEVSRRTCIVIIEVNDGDKEQVIGVIVDAVSEVLEIAPTHIEPTPAFGTKIRTDFIKGIGKVNGSFIILLDVDKVLSINELAELSGVSVPTSPVD